jgi:hypothetical protein
MPTLLPLLTTLALPESLSLQGYAELRGSYSPVEQGTPWTAAERLRPTLEWQPTARLGLTLTAEARASPTTVVRVARFLKEMPHQGYRLVLDRLKQKA